MLFNQNQMGRMIGQFMWATGPTSATPRIQIADIENREVGTWTLVNNVFTSTGFPTTGFPTEFRFNSNGTTLGVTYSTSPYVYFFNKIGNSYTKLADFAAGHIPNKTAQGISWHPNGKYVAAVFDANNNLGQCVVWERNADTFTTITNTASFTAAITATIALTRVAWNPQGDTLVMVGASVPYFLAYSFDETTKTFTKIVNPLNTHPGGRIDDVAWNHDGTSLALAAGDATRLYIYNRNSRSSTATFTKLANPTLPSGVQYGVAWGGTDSQYLVCNGGTTPYIHFYLRSGDTFMKAANPATVPAGLDGFGCDISPDGRFVISVHYNGNATYFRRDTATTNTWVNIGAQIPAIYYGRGPSIYQSYKR